MKTILAGLLFFSIHAWASSILSLKLVDDSLAYNLGSDGRDMAVRKSTDGGKTWTKLSSLSKRWFTAIDLYADKKVIVILGVNTQGSERFPILYTTYDEGKHWSRTTVPIDGHKYMWPYHIRGTESTLVIYGTADNELVISVSAKNNFQWREVHRSKSSPQGSIDLDKNTFVAGAYCSGAGPCVHISTDAGENWQTKVLEVRDIDNILSVSTCDGIIGIAGYLRAKHEWRVLVSADMGDTWTVSDSFQHEDQDSAAFNIRVFSDGQLLVAGNSIKNPTREATWIVRKGSVKNGFETIYSHDFPSDSSFGGGEFRKGYGVIFGYYGRGSVVEPITY